LIIALTNINGNRIVQKAFINSEKIASNVLQYDVMGENIYFIDDDHDLSMFQIKDNQETEILF
jgi:hypothetical protein